MVVQMNKVTIPSDALGLHTNIPLTPRTQGLITDSRDPLDVNGSIQASFNSAFGEPEGLRSPQWAWKLSSEIYTFVQLATYRLLVVILGPLFSFIAAVHFGILHFLQIWVGRPILKFFHVIFTFTRSFLELSLNGVIGPVLETAGLLCSKIKIRHQRVYESKDEPNYPFII